MRPTALLPRLGVVAGLLALGLAACQGSGGPSSSSAAALKVVTTTTVFADIVQNVGGTRVAATSIIPPGVGPEDYEPKPDDARNLADAQLVVSNGLGLDDFLNRLLASGSGGSTPRLVLSDGIPAITIDGEANPHFWLDPTLVKRYYLPAIVGKLAQLDPGGAAEYGVNAARYGTQLDELDAESMARVEEIPAANRRLVTFHGAFPYFARHFGFQLIGVIVQNVGQEPSAADLVALVEKVKGAQVRAVFSEVQFSPRLAQTLAEEAGITEVVTTLYSDALGPAPADTYLGMMRWNVDQVVEALK